MFAANTYPIHTATEADSDTINALAARNGHAPLTGRVLLGRTPTGQIAALSLTDGTVIADPGAEHLASNLRIRAISVWTQMSGQTLRERLLAGLPTWYRAVATPVAQDTQNTDRQPEPAVA